jgi:hypothetical protein
VLAPVGITLRVAERATETRESGGEPEVCVRIISIDLDSATAEPNCFLVFAKEGRFNSRNTVTETAVHVVTPLPWPIELDEHAGE